jgi:hypothetical protein
MHMDKQRMIFETVQDLFDSEDDGTQELALLQRRLRDVAESCWQEGMTLDGLIQATRRKYQNWQ